MGWFSKFFEKDDWRLVGTIESPIVQTSPLKDDKEGMLYYYLLENQHGDRKFDAGDTFRGDLDLDEIKDRDIVYRSEEYLTKIKPWLNGRKITGVTTYEKVPHHDFKKQLKEGE